MRMVAAPARRISLALPGPAAINVNRELKIMVSCASFAAPTHPGRVVLRGLGPQGLATGAAL
ncbi:MAG TPA: hypothetical protein VJA64_00825 [Desulfobaccales bacterium]|nr:hypothetical protein [Desulfobaccales bacterium]